MMKIVPRGCYFATSASYADKYACDVRLPGAPRGRVRAIFLAAVLLGDCVVGRPDMYPPPQKATGERYEPPGTADVGPWGLIRNACDRLESPSILVTFKDHQALPLYVLLYQADSNELLFV